MDEQTDGQTNGNHGNSSTVTWVPNIFCIVGLFQ